MKDIDKALFFLVRHGTTELNEEDKFRGWSNDESAVLDDKGVKQAKVAGRFMVKLPIKVGVIFCSDLDRTVHTAAIVAKILGIKDIFLDERLRPLNVGDFTGEDKATSNIDFYLENPDEPFPNGESVSQFRARWKEFSEDTLFPWMRDHPDEKAILVDHLSGIIYWEDLGDALKGYLEDYASDKKDLVHPGGVVAVMPDNDVIALLGENKEAQMSDKGEE